MRLQVTIAILAGGKSSRFGGIDKQEIVAGGETLGRRAAKNGLGSGCPALIVGRNRLPYKDLPVAFADDLLPGFGPLSGLHAALSASMTEWVYLMACDMPYFSGPWLDYLLSLAGDDFHAVVAQSGVHVEPFHGLYSRKLAGYIETLLKDAAQSPRRLSLAGLVRESPHRTVPESLVREYTPDWRLFSSVNSPADLENFSPR